MDGDRRRHEGQDLCHDAIKKLEDKMDRMSEKLVAHEAKLNNGLFDAVSRIANAQEGQQMQLIELHKAMGKTVGVGMLFAILSAVAVIVSLVSTL